MELPNIDEAQRSEIEFALLARRAELEKLVINSTKMHARNTVAEKLLTLYRDDEDVDRVKGTRTPLPGLLAIFAGEPELSADAIRERDAGAARTIDGQQDIFGGGAETGAGTPANAHAFLDKYGNTHDTAEEVAMSNDGPDPRLDHGIGTEPSDEPAPPSMLRRLALASGGAHNYDEANRCNGCRAFRGEGHDATCPVGIAEGLAAAGVEPGAPAGDRAGVDDPQPWDEGTEAWRAAAAGARPSDRPPVDLDAATSGKGTPPSGEPL